MSSSDITTFLSKIRKHADVTQMELASRLGMNQVTVSLHERGERAPNLDLIERWAAACGGRAELVLQMPGEVPRTAGLMDAAAELDAQQLALVVRAVRAMAVLPAEHLSTEVEVLELKAAKIVRLLKDHEPPTYKVSG